MASSELLIFRGRKRKRGGGRLSGPDANDDDGVLQLPSELLSEILLHLPARELCRLRPVCRSWCSLTADPIFSKAHAARHPLLVSLRCDDDDRTGTTRSDVQFFDLSGNLVRQIRLPKCGYQMSAQVDLLCIYGTRCRKSCVLLDTAAPAASSLLPDATNSGRGGSVSVVIGVVPSTGEYKVLRIQSRMTPDLSALEQSCQVITLGTTDEERRWRTKQQGPLVCVALDDQSMASVDGVAYFLVSSYGIDHASVEPDGIASFDFTTEEWRAATLRGPLSSSANNKNLLSYRKYRRGLQLAALDGRLVTIHHHTTTCRDCCSMMDLWFLEDAGGRGLFWIKKYCLDYGPNWTSASLGELAHPYPLGLLDDGRILVWVPLKQALTAYDPETRTWAALATMSGYYTVRMHQGSLLSSRLQTPLEI